MRFYIWHLFGVSSVFDVFYFILFVLATLFIAAGGYIINDFFDVEADRINKPEKVWIHGKVTPKLVIFLYLINTVLGLVLGSIVSIKVSQWYMSGLFVLPVLGLYFYGYKLKKVFVINNLLISFLVSYVIIIFLFFEWNELIKPKHQYTDLNFVLLFLIVFSIIINTLREIVKDVEDRIGDRVIGVKSIIQKYGMQSTKKILQYLVFGTIVLIMSIVFWKGKNQLVFVLYLILAVIPIMILFLNQLKLAKDEKDFGLLSNLLKIIMLVGLFSTFLIKY